MLERRLSPPTLVNQIALTVLLSTAIGVVGAAISGQLVQGVQGSVYAIDKARSLRMQSYRPLAVVPLDASDQPFLDEVGKTALGPELTHVAKRDEQQAQLKTLQDY